MYSLRGYEIPEASRTARGVAIVNMLKIQGGEKVTAVVDCKSFDEEKHIIMATKKGIIKKVKIAEFINVRKNGLKAINIKEDDELISAKITNGREDIFLITKNGLCLRMSEEKIRDMGRTAAGVRGIKVAKEDELVSMLVTSEGKELFFISENGIGKRTESDEFSPKGRGTKGMTCYKPNEKTGKIVGAELVNGNEDIMVINEIGSVIRLQVSDIGIMGRTAKGVRIMKQDENVKVASITTVLEEKE